MAVTSSGIVAAFFFPYTTVWMILNNKNVTLVYQGEAQTLDCTAQFLRWECFLNIDFWYFFQIQKRELEQ